MERQQVSIGFGDEKIRGGGEFKVWEATPADFLVRASMSAPALKSRGEVRTDTDVSATIPYYDDTHNMFLILHKELHDVLQSERLCME